MVDSSGDTPLLQEAYQSQGGTGGLGGVTQVGEGLSQAEAPWSARRGGRGGFEGAGHDAGARGGVQAVGGEEFRLWAAGLNITAKTRNPRD